MMKHKEFVLADIAKLDNGNKMDKNKMTRKNPSVNFVSRTALNNGISDYVDKIKDIEPFPAGCITLAFWRLCRLLLSAGRAVLYRSERGRHHPS